MVCSNLRKGKGREECPVCTAGWEGKNVGCVLDTELCMLWSAGPRPQPPLDINGNGHRDPPVGSTPGLALFLKILSFPCTKLRRRPCLCWWCFSPFGSWWFYCSNLFYGLSAAFDYVTFALFYHRSLPPFFHFEMKNRIQRE